MSDQESLEGALNEEVIEGVAQPEVEAEAETAEASPETTGSTGEESSPPEDSIESLKAKLDDINSQVEAFKAKAIDETGKRQQIEQQFQALQNQVAGSQSKPDFWEDPDAALSAMAQNFNAQLQQINTNVSVQVMKGLHDDYSEMESVFVEAAQKNPALIAQMNQSDNPAKFAYEYGKTQKQMAEFSNPEEMRAKMKAELLAEIEDEQKAKIEAEINKRSELPGSLANERAAAGTSTYAPPDLENLIG